MTSSLLLDQETSSTDPGSNPALDKLLAIRHHSVYLDPSYFQWFENIATMSCYDCWSNIITIDVILTKYYIYTLALHEPLVRMMKKVCFE